jgi:hypothetical protein
VYFNSFLIKAILRKVQINIRKSKLNESNVLGHAITSLTLHQAVASHRGEYYAALAQSGRCPQGDLKSTQRYYSPNLHELKMVTEPQVATARAAAAAFDASRNRVPPPSLMLGLFHI